MSFSTLFFILVFLPVSLILYYAVPQKYRAVPLVVLSLVFYAWGKPLYLPLLLISLAFNYFSALEIAALKDAGRDRSAKASMVICVTGNLLLLCYFKYLSFLIANLNLIPGITLAAPELSLPIGLSFYTFTILSYVLDVYRDRAPVQKNVLRYLVYATFFAKFVSGPIVQYRDLQAQLETPVLFKRTNLESGIKLFCIGLFKKVLISDHIAPLFAGITGLSSMSVGTAWLGLIFYSFQLYFDFSGYSDMAIGLAEAFGFSISPNFNYPYRSVNITDFWRRWHISLGAWFREYVYFPLGGSRCSKPKLLRNLLIIWLLTGIWHGASWCFILWGLWHGLFSILERLVIKDRLDRLPSFVRILITYIIVILGWTLFFSGSLSSAGHYYSQLFGAGGLGLFDGTFLYYLRSGFVLLLLSVLGSGPLPKQLHQNLIYRQPLRQRKRVWISTAVFTVLFLLSIACMVSATYSSFLYFQF